MNSCKGCANDLVYKRVEGFHFRARSCLDCDKNYSNYITEEEAKKILQEALKKIECRIACAVNTVQKL